MAAKDARLQPIYNCKHRLYIDLLDSDGALIALASADTELGKDGAALADATNEMSEISTGHCSLDLEYSEMAYTCVTVIPKSTGALTIPIYLFPLRLPVLRSGTAQAGAAATMTLDSGASDKDGAYVGCLLRCSNNTPAGVQGDVSKIIGYVGSTKVATVADNWTDTPTSSTTFEILVPSDMSIATLLANAADLNAEVVDALATDTYAEPGQETPGATISLAAKINYLYKYLRNKKTNDGSTEKLYNDAGDTVDQKSTISSAAGTVTKGEIATGP
jgi:hypothetical protein